MANVFEQLMALNRESANTPKKVIKVESRKIPVKKIKLESRKIFEEEDLDVIDDKFDVDIDNVEDPENDEVVLVIDPELPAEGEEEPEVAAEDMIGDMVYKCPVCGANYLCDCDHLEEEGIEVGEDGTPVACPICGDETDQILIGEIAPADDVKEEDEVEIEPSEPTDPEDKEDDEEDLEVKDDEEVEEVEEESVKAPEMPRSFRRREFVTPDGKTRKGGDPTEFARKAGEEVAKTGSVTSTTVADAKKKGVNIDPKTGKVSVADSVMRRPLARRPMVKENKMTRMNPIKRPARPLARRPMVKESLEIDNVRFNKLMNRFLKENYKGERVCILKDAYIKNNDLVLEYVVRGGMNSISGKLVSKNFNPRNVSRMRFEDVSHTFAEKGGYPFVFESIRRNNMITPRSISYNFKKKVNESVYQVRGTHSLNEIKKK